MDAKSTSLHGLYLLHVTRFQANDYGVGSAPIFGLFKRVIPIDSSLMFGFLFVGDN